MKDKRIFITGGTGYIGSALVEHYYPDNDITVYSRNEACQVMLAKKFPKLRCVVGDIRNYALLKQASAGCNIGIFCASLKHVGVVNRNIVEAEEIIVGGGINSRRVAIENGFESACFVSTDKSRLPITLYGAMKFVAGESFIWGSESAGNTMLSTAVLGNITNSTGSVIPMIWNSILNKKPMLLHSAHMTRFMMDVPRLIESVNFALSTYGGNVVPALKSFMVQDLFSLYEVKHGLQYSVGQPMGMVERDHELLISEDDAPRTTEYPGGFYYIHHNKMSDKPAALINNQYATQDHLITINDLRIYLEVNNWFKPLCPS